MSLRRFALPVLFSLLAAVPCFGQGGNGSDRGGGDESVAEFQDIKRSILAAFQSWIADGSLTPNDSLKKFLTDAPSVRIFSLEMFPKNASPAPEDGFWIDAGASPARLTFLRPEWGLKKALLSRVELETLAFEKLLRAVKVTDSSWLRIYADRSLTLTSWKEEKNHVLQSSLAVYASASRYLESNPHLIFEATLKTLFVHSDFERCTARGIYKKAGKRLRNEACDRWFRIFWDRIEQISPAQLEAPLQKALNTLSGHSDGTGRTWLTDRAKTFETQTREIVEASIVPYRQLREDFEAQRAGLSLTEQALSLETLRVSKHEASKQALDRALVDLDTAFGVLSKQFAGQVSAP